MPDRLSGQFGPHHLIFFAERALWWPERRRLIIADLHLGKDEIFRRAGIAVPRGGTDEDLRRLSRLLTDTSAAELWIAGDLTHDRHLRREFVTLWQRLLESHPAVRTTLIRGNHDRDLPTAPLAIESVTGRIHDSGIMVGHDSPDPSFEGVSITGHMHPKVSVPGLPGKWPAFRVRAHAITLPAFSLFTGGVQVEQHDGWIACVQGELVDGRLFESNRKLR